MHNLSGPIYFEDEAGVSAKPGAHAPLPPPPQRAAHGTTRRPPATANRSAAIYEDCDTIVVGFAPHLQEADPVERRNRPLQPTTGSLTVVVPQSYRHRTYAGDLLVVEICSRLTVIVSQSYRGRRRSAGGGDLQPGAAAGLRVGLHGNVRPGQRRRVPHGAWTNPPALVHA